MSMNKNDKIARDYSREMMKSAFVSLYWSVISQKKRSGGSMKEVADKLGIDKSAVSRWFSGKNPNWELNTIADLAEALDLDLHIQAIDRKTGEIFNCSGDVVKPIATIATSSNAVTLGGALRTRSSPTGQPVEIRGTRVVA